jgi:hypothetical protein
MAWRMLMTPTLLDAADPAAAGAWAHAAAALKMHAAARAAVRVNTFRDRKAVNVFRDRKAVNNLEFTLFSLLWSATEKPGRTRAKSAWLKTDSAPSGHYECIANFGV